MPADYLNPQALSPTHGWTQVVRHGPGTLIHISGQAAVTANTPIVGPGDLKQQTEQTFQNLTAALAAAGATWSDVIVTRLYVVNLKPEHVPIIREVRSRFVSRDNPPASTLVGVTALVHPEWLIEIEATAFVSIGLREA